MKKAFRKQFKGVEGVVTIDELFDIKQKDNEGIILL
jgi:hypothetical protein